MKKPVLFLCILVAAALGAWTGFMQGGTAVGVSLSGASSGKGIQDIYFGLALWSFIYFLGLCVLALICRKKKDRASVFRMAIFPILITHSLMAFKAAILPSSVWILILGILIALAAAALFGIGSLIQEKKIKQNGVSPTEP